MILELHLIQNFAPSNLNRDDMGAPKDAEFGGYRRARISSQALKRAIRTEFKAGNLVGPADLGTRTKRVVEEELVPRLTATGRSPEEARQVAGALLGALKLAVKEDQKTQYLLFLGQREIAALASVALDYWSDLLAAAAAPAEEPEKKGKRGKKEGAGLPPEVRKELLGLLNGGQAVDIGLFGRMIADLPDRNVDAAAQVAHAISTHKVSMEFDFYTAVDDLKPNDNQGADMMGTVQFNSACFYRYANIDLNQLATNLADKAKAMEAATAFVAASVQAIPTGKQNSMAAHNPPSLVLAVLRDRGAWNLANAFVRPVRPDGGDLVVNSIQALDAYWAQLCRMYGREGVKSAVACQIDEAVTLKSLAEAQVPSVADLLHAIREALASHWAASAQ
jgi:CRISPR system Cascade subunit CasC